MFLCGKCHDGCECFGDLMPSWGACEQCKRVGACADCHAHHHRAAKPRAPSVGSDPRDIPALWWLRQPLSPPNEPATAQVQALLARIKGAT